MQFLEAVQGRTFVLRLEHGEIVHEAIEGFCRERSVSAAAVIALGGADRGSTLVAGPEDGRSKPVRPLHHVLEAVHEVSGTGTVFPDETGSPVLHMHMACGRQGSSATGCVRSGVSVWQVLEVILFELTGCGAKRVHDPEAGLGFLRL
jgi:predicted DNA-binding protein with PD1-like motif